MADKNILLLLEACVSDWEMGIQPGQSGAYHTAKQLLSLSEQNLKEPSITDGE